MGNFTGSLERSPRLKDGKKGKHANSYGPMESFTFVSLDGPHLTVLWTGAFKALLTPQL